MTSYDFMMQQAPGKVHGYNVRGTCPFCNHKDTFHWHTKDINPYKCQSCGETGNATTLGWRSSDYKSKHDLTPTEMFLWQRRRKFGKPWRLSDKVMREFDLQMGRGTTSKGKVVDQVEFKDRHGHTQKLLRAYIKTWMHQPKEVSLSEEFWLNEQRASRSTSKPLFVCAGEWDLFALWEHTGLHGISPTNGENSTPKEPEHMRVFQGRHVVIAYDNDPTGRAAAKRLAAQILSRVKTESLRIIDMLKLGCPPGQDLDYFFNELSGTEERLKTEVKATELVTEAMPLLDKEFLDTIPDRDMPMPKYANPTLAPEILDVVWRASIQHENARRRTYAILATEEGEVDITKKGQLKQRIEIYENEARAMIFASLEKMVKDKISEINLTAEHDGQNTIDSRNYYYYVNGVYVPFTESQQRLLCDEIARQLTPSDNLNVLSRNRNIADEQVELNKKKLIGTKFNQDLNIINFRNCLLDLKTGETKSHSPIYKMTFQLNIDYDSGAECSNFNQAMDVWFKEDEIRREFLKSCYYILSGDRSAQVAIFWYGAGGDGKGEAAKVLRALIGDERTSAVSLEDLENKFMVGQLYNKMLNIADEVGRRTLINDSRFKNVTGNSTMTADMKYGRIITFESMAQWVILTNNMPASSDNSRGFARRLKFINFEHVPSEKRVPDFFRSKLEGELPGIARLIFTEGKRLYEAEGFRETKSDHDTKQDLFRKNSVNSFWMESLDAFFSEIKETGVVPSEPLELVNAKGQHGKKRYIYTGKYYEQYLEFCKEQGFQPVNQENFRQDSKNQIERAIKDPGVNFMADLSEWVVESGVLRISVPKRKRKRESSSDFPLYEEFETEKKLCRVLVIYALPKKGSTVIIPPPKRPAPEINPDEPINFEKLWSETP